MQKALPVQCTLCYKRCELVNGQRGDCRVRINLDGELKTLVYATVCARHVDPIEKKPLFHVLPGSSAYSIATAGCNLHCKFCQNWEISQREPEQTQNIYLPPDRVIGEAEIYGCRSIAYTYSEPVVFYEYTFDCAKIAKKAGLLNLMITALTIEEDPLRELCPLMDAANVDLKSFSKKYYHEVCSGSLKAVLDALVVMKSMGVWVEITNLVLPGMNDSPSETKALAGWIRDNLGPETPLHFSRFWPMYRMKNLPPTPVSTLTRARKIAMDQGLKYVYVGNVPGHEGNNTFCPTCGKIIIGRRGYRIWEYALSNGRCKYCGTEIEGIWSN